MELADTSAWTNHSKDPVVSAEFQAQIAEGEVATCDMVEAELLWTARSLREFDAISEEFRGLRRIRVRPVHWERAIAVWRALTKQGRLREVKHADLLIAAVAELAEVPILHYDRHFELIAEVTDQPHRALAPLGSLG